MDHPLPGRFGSGQEDYGTMRGGDRILCGAAQTSVSSDLQKDGDDSEIGARAALMIRSHRRGRTRR